MAISSLKEQIMSQLDRLTSGQQKQVLDYANGLTRLRGTPGEVFIERTRDIHIDPEDLHLMEQVIEEECERIDLDEWDLPA